MKKAFIIIFISLHFICNAQVWAWAKNSSGSDGSSHATCTDINNNVFITGSFDGPSITFGAYSLTTISGSAFLTKYDSNGNVLWAKSSASSTSGEGESGFAVATDLNGNSFVTGHFNNQDVFFDSYTLTSNDASNAFLVKYDPSGSALWAKSGQGHLTGGLSVCTDTNGNVFMSGVFSSTAAVFGAYTLTNSNANNIFIVKYDSGGNVVWAKTAPGTISNYAHSVSTDLAGNAYVTGHFTGPTITFGATTLTNTGSQNIFLTKYDPAGNVIWAKNTVGSGTNYVFSVSTDISGNSYIAGYYTSPTLQFGSITLTKSNYYNIFLTKYDSNGNAIWAKAAKGLAAGFCATQDQNSVYLCGGFRDTLILTNYTLTAPQTSSTDLPMFIIQYDLNGNEMYATSLLHGGSHQNSISVDRSCNAYVTSDFANNGTGFTIGANTLNITGARSTFLAKLSLNCQITGIERLSNTVRNILVYPNPNNGSFNVQTDDEIKNGSLVLLNSLGQKVYNQKIMQGDNVIDGIGLNKGLYNYILFEDNQKIKSGKLIVK